jgi:hypothetical protein
MAPHANARSRRPSPVATIGHRRQRHDARLELLATGAAIGKKASDVHAEVTSDNNHDDHHTDYIKNTHLFSPLAAI